MSLQTPVMRDVKTFGLKSTMLAVECMNQIALTVASAKVGAAPVSLKKFKYWYTALSDNCIGCKLMY
jgi:hypothetical protein